MAEQVITRQRILEEFKLLNNKAQLMVKKGLIPKETVINLYLIGGGNMALRKIKEATKDIDVVIENNRAYQLFHAILTNVQVYSDPNVDSASQRVVYVKEEPNLKYTKSLGAMAVYKKIDPKDQDFNLDVFVKRVGRKLYLSNTMKNRATLVRELRSLKVLRVYLVSKEDIFLFKGVTSVERERDIDDMKRLIESGLKFSTVISELQRQRELLIQEPCEYLRLLTVVCEKAKYIKDDFKERGLETKVLDQFITSLLGLPVPSSRKRKSHNKSKLNDKRK